MNKLVTDLKNLELETLKNLRNSKSANTLRAYESDYKDFSAFCAMILVFAFSTPFLNLKHDISYGLYVWHMVVINLLIVIEIRSLLVMMVLTILSSIVSWLLVERPMLKKKKVSLRASA